MKREPIDSNEKRARYRINRDKYRINNRRFDYVPSAALSIIEAAHAAGLDSCFAGVIHRLILAGGEAISGEIEGMTP